MLDKRGINLDLGIFKANDSEFTEQEMDDFLDKVIEIAENYGWSVGGGISFQENNDESLN